MDRLLALRRLQEERAEAEVSKQRRLHQVYSNALRASEERSAAALRELHSGLQAGDRAAAISAEMALAFGPLEQRGLQYQLSHLEPIVEAATMGWRNARTCRMQIEALSDAAETRSRKERELREQKALDDWILSDRDRSEHENFQREDIPQRRVAGMTRAVSTSE